VPLEARRDARDHGGIGSVVDDLAELFGQANHPDRERDAVREDRARAGTIQPGEFRAAAADVEHQDVPGSVLDQRQAPEQGEPTLLGAVQDLEGEARGALDALQKGRAVVGAPARRGGDATCRADPAPRHDPRADAQRLERALFGSRAQPTGRGDTFAEPDDAREALQDLEARVARTSDQKAAVIGAEIERGHRRHAAPSPAPTVTTSFRR
jgi:hypothetical protein